MDATAPPPATTDSPVTLEFEFAPEGARRLARLPALTARRTGAARTARLEIVWHDTPEGTLAAAGETLAERHAGRSRTWRLEQPGEAVPGALMPPIAEAASKERLGRPLPAPLLPVAAFSGRVRSQPLADGVTLRVLEGGLRAVTGAQPACRVHLEGPAVTVAALAEAIVGPAGLRVPERPLAFAALAVAGRAVSPRRLGAPALAPAMTVGDAFAHIVAHLAGVLVHYASGAVAGADPEPVHQMRVALRRLRSAAALFDNAVDCPEVRAARADLKALANVLGPARDWDVFIGQTSGAVARQFSEDATLARLMTAAERRRGAGYAALRTHLDGPAFQALLLRLTCLAVLRPWQARPPAEPGDTAAEAQAQVLAMPLVGFAAEALERRLRHVLAAGPDLAALTAEERHAVRIRGKRLRYAAEFFSPLFSVRDAKKFIRRITNVQDQLGLLNDSAVAAGLLGELGTAGRGYAAGLIIGHVAAGGPQALARVGHAWRKFRRAKPFWA
jgi:triphosphatase